MFDFETRKLVGNVRFKGILEVFHEPDYLVFRKKNIKPILVKEIREQDWYLIYDLWGNIIQGQLVNCNFEHDFKFELDYDSFRSNCYDFRYR